MSLQQSHISSSAFGGYQNVIKEKTGVLAMHNQR